MRLISLCLIASLAAAHAMAAPAPVKMSQAEYAALVDQKIAALDAVLKADPANARAWDERGYAKILRGGLIRALAVADGAEAVRLEPGSSDFRYHHAIALAGSNQYVPALEEMNEAIRLAPGQVKLLAYRSVLHSLLDRGAASQADLAAARKLSPKDPAVTKANAAINARAAMAAPITRSGAIEIMNSALDLYQLAAQGVGP